MNPTTIRQRQVLRAIRAHQLLKGFPITIRELGNELGIRSLNGVCDHLRALEKRGLVHHEKHRSRTLQLTVNGIRELGATT